MSGIATGPITWGLVGHAAQSRRLHRFVSTGQYPPAILITGSAGVGRKALAQAMAKAAICPERPTGEFCGTCSVCIRIDHNNHPDVQIWSVDRQEVETSASKSASLTIETVRRLAASTALRPQEANHRFVILDDAETLNDPSQQALLKTLEDAPAFVTIVLIASSSAVLLDTVLSRCVEIPLQLVPTVQIQGHLNNPDAATIAALAAGRPGWAISAAADPKFLSDEQEAVSALESWIAMPRRDRLVEAYKRGDRYLKADKRAILQDVSRLQIIWRDVALAAANLTSSAYDPERSRRIQAREPITLEQAYIALAATCTCHNDLIRNIRPRLAMQSMVNQWPIL